MRPFTVQPYAIHSVLKNPDYELDFEEFRDASDSQMILAHLAVSHFTPSVLKRMLQEWQDLRDAFEAPLFAIEPTSTANPLWERFIGLFGFRLFDTVGPEDNSRRMFVSTIDRPTLH